MCRSRSNLRFQRQSLSFALDSGTLWLTLDGARSALEGLGMTLMKVQASAMELSTSERAELLDWLWDGLQPRGVLELQERWAAEAEQRIDAVDRGDLSTVDGPTALEELRRSMAS